ncbi:MAG TPA: uracil-DNA glycosylase [Aquabacterium sp.]|uniref:uracil-DNA glycosylase n=1 Tax=Aquabacterium sp. TaxID=1872578 RepID=UPI002E367907|nr:uracil-DNA glycosylase [Aquabacterium sp.]HEX5374028.1 uracil-DNA glycosylase [Aquabacterium sp.]
MSRWPERRLAMLREMGVQHFWPTDDEADAVADASPPAVQAVADAGEVRAAVSSSAPLTAPTPARARPAAAATPTPAPAVKAVSTPVALGPRPVGVDTMDWPALREAVAGCQACGLCQGRQQTVFGVGHPQARWMLVGEAPGEQEDRQGEPFVGRAGQLLDRMLTAVGLTRAEAPAEQQVYIANVIKCRPPGNRNPLPEEVAQCEPFLLRQVQLVQPRLILAMGRFAVQSLLRSAEPIGRLRGKVHDYHGVPLVVTYHPAYLLRNPADKALVWDDLCLARELVSRRPDPAAQ